MPFVIDFHEAPKSVVLYTNGSRLFTWWKSTVMYAVPASYRDGSILLTVPQTGRFWIFFVTLDQLLPLSRVTCTSLSFACGSRRSARQFRRPCQNQPRSTR